MRRFNPATYDPDIDSSPGTLDLRHPDNNDDGPVQTGVILIIEAGQCQCGCGHKVRSKKADFIPGHDAKLKGKLIRAALADLRISLNSGGLLTEMDAFTVAQLRGWGHFIEASEAAASRSKTKKSAGKVQAPVEVEVDSWLGALVTFKDGRWEREGTVVLHDAIGHGAPQEKVEITYEVKGKGKRITLAIDKVTRVADDDANDEAEAEAAATKAAAYADLDDEAAAAAAEAEFDAADEA